MESQEVTLIIGAVSALVVAVAGTFLKYLKSITKADREERIETAKLNASALSLLAQTLQDNTLSNREIAEATKRSADEAKERNGHLAELQLKSQEMIDRNLKAYKKDNKEVCKRIREISTQHVARQEVDVQSIKSIKE